MEQIKYTDCDYNQQEAFLYGPAHLTDTYYSIAIRPDGHNIIVWNDDAGWYESFVYSEEPI